MLEVNDNQYGFLKKMLIDETAFYKDMCGFGIALRDIEEKK
jgi:hypothetical protein